MRLEKSEKPIVTRPDNNGRKATSLANFPRSPSHHKPAADKQRSEVIDENNRSMHDHISIVLLSSAGPDSPNEYFLYLEPLTTEFNLLGVQPVGAQESWKPTVESFFKDIGLNLKSDGLVRLDRYYVPGSDRLSLHGVHCVTVKQDTKSAISKAFAGTWVTAKQVGVLLTEKQLFSSDIADVISQLDSPRMALAQGTEMVPSNVFVYPENPKQGKRSTYEVVVEAAQLKRFEQELLYGEFMRLVAPFATMGYGSFSKLMKDLGWAPNALPALFRAFDVHGKSSLDFRDLLCGIAATEPNIQHGGPPAECRCRYIFRYFDEDEDNRLNSTEFKNLMAEIRKVQGISSDNNVSLEAETEKSYKIFGHPVNSSIPLSDFLNAVGQLRFRGTSHLLRSPMSIMTYLKKKSTAPAVNNGSMKRSRSFSDSSNHPPHNGAKVDDAYDIATHSIRVRKSGTVLDVHTLWDIEHSGILNNGSNNKQASKTDAKDGTKANRILSFDRFNQDSQPNEMINGLRYFERVIPRDNKSGYSAKQAFEWGEVDRSSLARCIIGLCKQAKELFMNEPRLVELASPVYILGDIHGNFPDLLCFEKALWRLGPMLTPASFLFLGDYVDRGAMGIEVISYLLAQKLLAPTKFYLLRGNHEIRDVQLMFTFYTECVNKFGEKIGPNVWEAINTVFDVMPLAVVIDKKVFCAHGGIPPPWIGNGLLKAIKSIPCPLPNPEQQSPLAWELMWSDPVQDQSIVTKDGFGSNNRRGTGHVFSEDALNTFLAKNQLSHVVRAHEVQQAGFQIQLGGKLLTVFSSSKYCGGSNEAACILADKFKLRTIRIDTT